MEEDTNKEIQTEKPMNKTLMSGLGILILVMAGGFLLNRGSDINSNIQTAPTQDVQGVGSEMDDNAAVENTGSELITEYENGVVVVNMEAGSFHYNPNKITVKKGQTVRIEFKAKDMMHDINIDELDVDGPIVEAGELATVEFVADRAGEFEYYCSVGQHRSLGQVGTLVVEE
jgi:plastocyanin